MRLAGFVLLSSLLLAQSPSGPAATRAAVERWTAANRQPIVDELIALLRIPNVAADRANILRNVEFLEKAFARRGFATRRLETTGNPLFFAERRTPGATQTTLIYAHADGQPVDAKAWNQPDPFAPVLRDDRIYARSASDDKGPIVALLAALDALAASGIQPSTHLKVIIDTEEEASSPSLVPAVKQYRDLLAADMMLIFDGPIHSSGRPTLAFGARGIITATLTVFGPRSGVHSGNYGNWVPNPALRLSQLIASMKDDEGRVTVEGYYDDVAPLTAEERALLAAVPEDSAELMRTFGIAAPERAGRSLQDALQEPTLNIRGLASSFVGAGVRTIIPDRATAEIDLRLVKETSGQTLMQRIADHVRRQGYHLADGEPDDAARATYSKIARLRVGQETPAFRTSPLLPESRALASAMEAAFGVPPVQIRTLGGTVPIAPFVDALNVPAVLVPIVNFDNNQHEENENLRLGHFFTGIQILAVALTR